MNKKYIYIVNSYAILYEESVQKLMWCLDILVGKTNIIS